MFKRKLQLSLLMPTHTAYSELFKVVATITLLCSLLILNSCRSAGDDSEDNTSEADQEQAYEKAPLAEGQSLLLDSQVDSAAEWQSWHQDLFRQANNERRIIFAIIGSGTDPNMLNTLASINQSSSLKETLRKNHINTIIDTNLHPDMELYMTQLSLGSRLPPSNPMLAWFSYEGNLVSWTPVSTSNLSNIKTLIQRTSNTVHNLWLESPEYTLANSRRDSESRSKMGIPKPVDPAQDGTISVIKPISRIKSLFNPISNTVDKLDNFTAARYVNLMILASRLSQQSANQQEQLLGTAQKVTDKMLINGLIDPLDGGVYSGYNGVGQNLPKFSKTLRVQSLSMLALYQLYQSTRDEKYRIAADRIAAFTKQYLAQDDGSLAMGVAYLSDAPNNHPKFWTLEEISKLLSAEELDIAIDAYGLSDIGNISLTDDPKRFYFRQNILTWKTTAEDLAKSKSISTTALSQVLESISAKLLSSRSRKPSNSIVEKLSTSGSLATYAYAHISGYRATADASHLSTAEETMRYIKEQFITPDKQLQRASYKSQVVGIPAKAIDYALVCQAALNLNEVTLNPEWLTFAHDIHTQMNKQLREPKTGFIREFNGKGYPKDYRVYNYYTINESDNESTWAIANSNAKRLSLQIVDASLTEQIQQLSAIMLQNSQLYPLSMIDYLTQESIFQSARVYLKPPMDDAMLALTLSHPCQVVVVNNSGTYPELGIEPSEIKSGSCILFINGERIGQASSQKQLKLLLTTKP